VIRFTTVTGKILGACGTGDGAVGIANKQNVFQGRFHGVVDILDITLDVDERGTSLLRGGDDHIVALSFPPVGERSEGVVTTGRSYHQISTGTGARCAGFDTRWIVDHRIIEISCE